jgi:hypothetical protein
MHESPREPTTARTNVYMSLFIQETSWSTLNTFLTRYRSGGTPNEPQPRGACELQGWWIEAPGLPALMLPVKTQRWVLVDNNRIAGAAGQPNQQGLANLLVAQPWWTMGQFSPSPTIASFLFFLICKTIHKSFKFGIFTKHHGEEVGKL